MALRVEFSGHDHPVGREIERISETAVSRVARVIKAGRRDGSIPPGPPARVVALAFMGALEGAVIALSQIVYSALCGLLVFGEPLVPATVAGGALILGAAVWAARTQAGRA